VTLFDDGDRIGGQLNWALRVPGKGEFRETLRYFSRRIHALGVDLKLQHRAGPGMLEGFDEVVLATGVVPRTPEIDGVDHSSVLSYLDALAAPELTGVRVAIVGAGGVGFDVADLLTTDRPPNTDDIRTFLDEWGIDRSGRLPGGLLPEGRAILPCHRTVYLLQRKARKVGADLGKTTGWIHRKRLLDRGVEMISGVTYDRIDDRGLHVSISGAPRLLEVDTVVLCAGQDPLDELRQPLLDTGRSVHVIGGARRASGLDAVRVIREGVELAATL